MFSRIDEHLDKVYIPWYDPKTNQEREFMPDFIFWFSKGNNFFIIFVDPKSINYAEYQLKVDSFKIIFEEAGYPKVFRSGDFRIKVFLYLITKDRNEVSEEYRKYWYDSVESIFKRIEVGT